MSRMKEIAVSIAFLAILLPTSDPLPRVASESVGVLSTRLNEATALLNRFVQEKKIAGAVAAAAIGAQGLVAGEGTAGDGQRCGPEVRDAATEGAADRLELGRRRAVARR